MDEYCRSENPLLTTFIPLKIEILNDVLDFCAGDEFSNFITKKKSQLKFN